MTHVLDSSAVIAFLKREPGAEAIRGSLQGALMSAVNFSEAIAVLMRHGASFALARTMVEDLFVTVVPFDVPLAHDTAHLETQTRAQGLSLADRACLALARREKLPAITADRAWRNVQVGVEIRCIR